MQNFLNKSNYIKNVIAKIIAKYLLFINFQISP